jgi:hypothetical protein
LSFPEDPKEAAEFQNRGEDNLPLELKGIALWSIRQNFTQSSYTILGPGGVWVPVEYINNQWYYTYWSPEEGTFWMTKSDLIEDPNRQGLGTLAEPTRPKRPEKRTPLQKKMQTLTNNQSLQEKELLYYKDTE